MPKLKTHSGAKKRISITRNGKLLRRHTSGNHFLEKKSASRKRGYAGLEGLGGKSEKTIKLKLGV